MAKELPRSVAWIRILLFVVAGLPFVFAAALFVLLGGSARDFGYVLVVSLPGMLQALLGLFVPPGRAGGLLRHPLTEVLFVLYTLLTLAGDGRVTQLVFPVAILVLLSRPSAREFFLAR